MKYILYVPNVEWVFENELAFQFEKLWMNVLLRIF